MTFIIVPNAYDKDGEDNSGYKQTDHLFLEKVDEKFRVNEGNEQV